jgi:ParB-like chromosome segregation protein Spo0J
VDVLAQLNGAALPLILLRRNTLQIVDGRHRYEAAQQRGDTHIAVAFFDGTAEEALAVAVRRWVASADPRPAIRVCPG